MMLLDIVLLVVAGIMFYRAGEQDFRTRTIKSLTAISLYLIASMIAIFNPASYIGTAILVTFTSCFVANQLNKENTVLMGWGDALLYPVFVGLTTFMFPNWWGLILCVLPLGGGDLHKRIFKDDEREGSPLIYYCALVFTASILYFLYSL